MDERKVRAIVEWESPKNVSELRSFLGLINYYRRFVSRYSARASPLTDLLKKKVIWEWTDKCQREFDELKNAVTKEPVLKLPDYSKPFLVQTDGSDFAIGGFWIQEEHLMAYESRKLNETEQRYHVHDKEMIAIINCLRVWRHYLLGSWFIIQTDNVATSYFQNQKKLNPKQAQLAALTLVTCNLVDQIKEVLSHDPLAKNLVEMVREGKTRKLWVEEGLLLIIGNRMYVPKWDNLRREVLKECHDSK
ncbi:unnamed protein product [Lactuca virosa]|uniref:Reverse transcriptase/retrotransposon-derived protein RNase H-like domain-containing protein n=1 Tax=Lactuca virosa TaxID=75947 RepID=A0AAU9LPH4_9ASTR|nr:unnamed protein product [Lactuca virosa]